MILKKLQTNKLFYGKYAYKISTNVYGGHLIRFLKFDMLKKWCSNQVSIVWLNKYLQIDKATLLDYINQLEPYLCEEIQLRTERNTVNIFLKDRELYDQMTESLKFYIEFISEPASEQELDTLLNDTKTVLCNQFPKGIYRYKVILKDMPSDIRHNFLNWSKQYSKKLHFPPNTKKSLQVVYPWWGDHYFYVSDDKMLLLTKLFIQGYIRRVEEYKLKSRINTI